MLRAGAIFCKRLLVNHRSVALVAGESIDREFPVKVQHQSIPESFSKHRGGSDAENKGVALDQRGLRDGNLRQPDCVNQKVLRYRGQLEYRSAHGQPGGGQDAEIIDLIAGCERDRPGERFLHDDLRPYSALPGGHLLGVAHAGQTLLDVWTSGQNYRSRRYGSRPGAAPGLIHTGGETKIQPPQNSFCGQVGQWWTGFCHEKGILAVFSAQGIDADGQEVEEHPEGIAEEPHAAVGIEIPGDGYLVDAVVQLACDEEHLHVE